MKPLLAALLIALSLSPSPALRAADSPPKSSPATAPSPLAGNYVGEWKATGDSTGDLRIKLKQEGTTWGAEALFTFQSADVPTQMKTVAIEGTKVVLVFDWQIQGTPGQSTIKGELKGDSLQGTFETKSPEGPSSGTWKVTRR